MTDNYLKPAYFSGMTIPRPQSTYDTFPEFVDAVVMRNSDIAGEARVLRGLLFNRCYFPSHSWEISPHHLNDCIYLLARLTKLRDRTTNREELHDVTKKEEEAEPRTVPAPR